ANAERIVIGDVHITGGVHGDRLRRGKRGTCCRTTISAGSRSTTGARRPVSSGVASDDACPAVYAPNGEVSVICNPEIVGGIHGYLGRSIQCGADGRSTVSRVTRDTSSRDRRNYSGRGDHADAIIGGVGNVHVAGAIFGDIVRIHQHAVGSCASITAHAATGDGRDRSRGIDLPNALISCITDQQVAGGIERYVVRKVQLSTFRGAIVTSESGAANSSHRADVSSLDRHAEHSQGCGPHVDETNFVVPAVDNIDIVRRIEEHRGWKTEICPRCRTTISAGAGWSQAALAYPYDTRDYSGTRVDHADPVVMSVCDVQVSSGVAAHAFGIIQIRCSCEPTIAARIDRVVTHGSVARHGSNVAGLDGHSENGDGRSLHVDGANAMVRSISDVDVASAVERNV